MHNVVYGISTYNYDNDNYHTKDEDAVYEEMSGYADYVELYETNLKELNEAAEYLCDRLGVEYTGGNKVVIKNLQKTRLGVLEKCIKEAENAIAYFKVKILTPEPIRYNNIETALCDKYDIWISRDCETAKPFISFVNELYYTGYSSVVFYVNDIYDYHF